MTPPPKKTQTYFPINNKQDKNCFHNGMLLFSELVVIPTLNARPSFFDFALFMRVHGSLGRNVTDVTVAKTKLK